MNQEVPRKASVLTFKTIVQCTFSKVIVVGTGLEESIVAAAAARNGHTVLHIDSNDFYGGQWSAFTFDGIQKWVEDNRRGPDVDESQPEADETLSSFLKDGETLVQVGRPRSSSTFSNVKQKWYVPEKIEPPAADEPEEQKEKDGEANVQDVSAEEEKPAPKKVEPPLAASLDQEAILKQAKRFSLDLMPHLLFSRGSMVELLIKSNISRYTEFKSVSRVLTVLNGILEHVPSSRYVSSVLFHAYPQRRIKFHSCLYISKPLRFRTQLLSAIPSQHHLV